ncbi:DJ-1/PfpI family protein [Nocardioides yefusunii]|uniref:DJ-1/PfpI family protein n=1 Tax=Nocardioides yefusunii TaxID=2500546 RepID=A0ABW1QUC3_9ACTN|nr:DJ-1/PfpI family protein [Nocardioides yefusunii]
MSSLRRVGILVFDDVEVLDACGPFEVFSVASRIAEEPLFEVLCVGTDPDFTSVQARGGLTLGVHTPIDTCPDLDVLLVPGGVTELVESDDDVLAWLRERSASAEVVASVCTGAFVLAQAGLLAGRSVTTHHDDAAALAARFPDLDVVTDRRWVGGDGLWTSAGISAGIDLALELVAELVGRDHARRTAAQMEYRWIEDPRA